MQAGYRTLAIWKLLRERTDEEHPMNAAEIAEQLRGQGMTVERRSIYRSIEELENYGLDIVHEQRKTQGFYLANREFELAEMKLLMDAVQAARFITGRKSRELIHKIASFASAAQAEELLGSVFVEDRAKCANEQIYYNIDAIYRAIRAGRQIAFQYCEYDLRRRRVPRRGGAEYVVSPYALEWNNDAYYLISRVGTLPKLTHFRVDRMKGIRALEEEIEPYRDLYDGHLDLAVYARRALSMFEGPLEEVEIRFRNNLVTAVVDRLGTDIEVYPEGDGWFTVRVKLVVGPGLTAWLAHFGGDAELLSPEHAREQMRATLRAMLSHYE